MANARIIVTKTLPFRGGREEYSNGYTFQADSTPWTNQQFTDLIDAVVAMERNFHSNQVQFVRASGGPQGQPARVVKDLLNVLGLLAPAGAIVPHPEVCYLAQAKVARGRVLQKYYHIGKVSATTDDSSSPHSALINTNVAKLTDGTLPLGVKACAPNGDIPPVAFTVDPFTRTHQFHQGKKRPPAA
jgi:hypothetical protein